MMTIGRGLAVPGRMLLCTLITYGAVVGSASGEPFFTDGFESGDLESSQNGFQWGGGVSTEVSNENPRTGDYSLRFVYEGGGIDDDAFAEQRFNIGRPLSEVWIQWQLYIPENYYHRNASPSNNKLLYLWSREYGGGSDWGNALGFEMWVGDGGRSRLTYNPVDHSGHKGHRPTIIDPASDAGHWLELTVHFRRQSSADSSDGVLEVWKRREGDARQKVFNLHNMDGTWGPSWSDWPEYNFLDKGYFLGWANSGFDEDTVFYIDDVVFSEQPIFQETVPSPPSELKVE